MYVLMITGCNKKTSSHIIILRANTFASNSLAWRDQDILQCIYFKIQIYTKLLDYLLTSRVHINDNYCMRILRFVQQGAVTHCVWVGTLFKDCEEVHGEHSVAMLLVCMSERCDGSSIK